MDTYTLNRQLYQLVNAGIIFVVCVGVAVAVVALVYFVIPPVYLVGSIDPHLADNGGSDAQEPCPYCIERANMGIQYNTDISLCPLHAHTQRDDLERASNV